MDDDYEHVLLVKPDVFIYKIPPRTSISTQHRASDWKLDQPDWKGRLRLVVKGKKCILKLEDKENCKLFAECFIENFPGSDVESVSDSSRYFVIKIKNPQDGRTAFIGIGFEDRSDSFDLNVALQDHFKRVQQEHDGLTNKDDDDNTPKIDLSLKEGQTIKVNLNFGGKKAGTSSRPKPIKSGNDNTIPLLLPPPPSQSSNLAATTTTTATAIQSISLNNEDSLFSQSTTINKQQSSATNENWATFS